MSPSSSPSRPQGTSSSNDEHGMAQQEYGELRSTIPPSTGTPASDDECVPMARRFLGLGVPMGIADAKAALVTTMEALKLERKRKEPTPAEHPPKRAKNDNGVETMDVSENPRQTRSSGDPRLINKVAGTSQNKDRTAACVAHAKNFDIIENQENAKVLAQSKAARAEKQRQGEVITIPTPPFHSVHHQVAIKDGKRTVTGTTVTTHDSTDVLVKKGSMQDNKATEAKKQESEEESDEDDDDDSQSDRGIRPMGAPPRPSKAEREAARKALKKAAKAKKAEAVAFPALPPSAPSINKDTPPSLKKETQVSHDASPRMEITTKSEPISKPQPTVNPGPGEQTSSSSERAQSDKLQVSTVLPVCDAKQKAEARTAAEDNKPRQSGSSKRRPPTKDEVLEMANVAKIQHQQYLQFLAATGRTKESPHPGVPLKASGNPSSPVPGSAPSQKPQTSSSPKTQVGMAGTKASQAQAKAPVSLNEPGTAAAQTNSTVHIEASGPVTDKKVNPITPQVQGETSTTAPPNTPSDKSNTAQEIESKATAPLKPSSKASSTSKVDLEGSQPPVSQDPEKPTSDVTLAKPEVTSDVNTSTTEAASSDITGTEVVVHSSSDQADDRRSPSPSNHQEPQLPTVNDQSVTALQSEIRQTAITHAFETRVLGHGLSAIRETQDTVIARLANHVQYCQLFERRLREHGLADSPFMPMIRVLMQDTAHTAENMAIETDAGINDVVADLATGRREVATYIERATRPSPTPVPSSSAIFIPWHQRPRVQRFTQPAPLDPDVQTDSETLAALLANPPR